MVSDAWDINCCLGLAASTLVLTFLGISSWVLRAPVDLPLVLLGSGWTLTAALHPNRELPLQERFTFALGLSLAIAVITGVSLNTTPWGLRPGSWAACEAGLTIAAGIFALRAGYGRTSLNARRYIPIRTREVLLLSVALAGTGLAIAAARSSWSTHQGVPFTALSMVPATVSHPTSAKLTVQNEESRGESYELKVTQGGTTLQEWSQITLAQGKSWSQTLPLGSDYDPSQTLTASLYRTEAPDSPYRTVTLVPRGD